MTDEGYFPRGRSLLRAVHEERVVGLFYGQRALAVGALDPRNFVGTIQSSAGRRAPFRRLQRTADAFETVFFGSRAEADRMLARVDRMHERVSGELQHDSGPYAAGTPFAAFDPELMLWTVAVTFDSAQVFYELFVRELSAAERDQLWQEYRRFGILFGMPASAAPRSYAEFRAWFGQRLASDEMHLTPEARYTGRAIAFEIPMGRGRALAKRIHDAIMRGALPPRVRELYGLRWSAADARRFRACVAFVRAGRRLAPRVLTHGSCHVSYVQTAAVERARLRDGRPTPQVPEPGTLQPVPARAS
ncbi:oxygenase MpaB family protein [Conexibacter sp. JD483]|uniref:oxygenase MpaB family protein n=1 Tax=unclassified Conexibacter TaxID=2627773 RepID=UPI0027236B55|nr:MULTISPECIES: oxygenase MpaB family protein [unclassified Conexibacter]MDO8185765.1 oxygenase MpaB family protein [Conexibacter sp. CPCC 205706]MDO8199142.1 oxygenase MpaB family protein [Conexibacter sp. CPCC 205762]MDR9369913.1 oxygenase MpaB family protein [Conexibacter sp. JD483]